MHHLPKGGKSLRNVVLKKNPGLEPLAGGLIIIYGFIMGNMGTLAAKRPNMVRLRIYGCTTAKKLRVVPHLNLERVLPQIQIK